ncbi:baculoviral IAP repeat-containing protein 7-B-like, partial [Mizuhopecten yessoensis]|uniref:baculoviral IAP repeat-containing protein 7-B-like n=1 Tax=Mizuhopecten yessoensis TaxID=6573 RepID=UPI000B4589ED
MLFERQSFCGQPTDYPSFPTCGSSNRSEIKALVLSELPTESPQGTDGTRHLSNRLTTCERPGYLTPGMAGEAHRDGLYNVTDNFGHKPPAHPKFSLYADRIQTFANWLTDLHQKPNDLAVAGFFYPGTADIVTCYSCGGSLKEWEPSDNPMVEHAHWFPSCDFLLRTKGEKFIMQAQLQSQVSSVSTRSHKFQSYAIKFQATN